MMFVSAFSLTIYAQTYKLGDLIEKDGIKALVVYVDESGEHGLMLSPRAYLGDECLDEPEITGVNASFERVKTQAKKSFDMNASVVQYKIKKACKKTGEDYIALSEKVIQSMRDSFDAQLELLDMVAQMPRLTCYVKHKDKEWNEMYQNILSSNSEYGKENTQAILDYCLKNDVSMQDWFPEYYWVTQLGQDWFIPGVHELELIGLQFVDQLGAGVKYSTNGFSKEKTEKHKKRRELERIWCHNWNYLPAIYPRAGGAGVIMLSTGGTMLINSSTLSKSTWGTAKENKDKIVFNSGNGSLIGTIVGAADKDLNVQFLAFFYGDNGDNGKQSFFATGTNAGCFAMAEF